jgi:tRNA splicing endonuclease
MEPHLVPEDHMQHYLFKLMREEAMFLIETRSLRIELDNGVELNVQNAALIFTRENTEFGRTYAAYVRLKSLGWTIQSGQPYGVHFMLYARHTWEVHSQFGVLVQKQDQQYQPHHHLFMAKR